MAKKGARRYFGRRGRRGGSRRGTIPLLGAAAGGALALGILARGNGQFQYAGSPAGYLKEGNWAAAMSSAGKNLSDAGTYMPMAVPLVALVLLRLAGQRVKLGKRVSLA